MALPIQTYKKKPIQMPMTALIDIVFLLLIYFLLTTNYLTSETLPLELPGAVSGVPQQDKVITISIAKEGEIHLLGTSLTDKELFIRLSTEVKHHPGLGVVLRSDRTVPLDRIVKVLDIAHSCSVKQLSLATRREDRKL